MLYNNNMDDLKKQIHNLKQLKTKDNSKEINNRIKELTKSVNKLEKENKNINKKNTEKVEKLKKKYYKQREKSQLKNEQKQKLFNSVKNFGKKLFERFWINSKVFNAKIEKY